MGLTNGSQQGIQGCTQRLNVALTCVQDRWGLPPEGDSDWGGMLGAMAMKKFKEGWREGS